ncbi:MAG: hypothetical protein GXP25_01165 [Planctomycetes bacterium]|nr:hypothetical protein [Planctomycetota bacterium]
MKTLLPVLLLLPFSILGRAQDADEAQQLAQIKKEYEAKDYATVTQLCTEFIKAHPYNHDVQAGEIQIKLMWSLHHQDRHDEASREAKAFIEHFPEHPRIAAAYYILGYGYEQLGEVGGWYDKAREAYQKALENERSPGRIRSIKKQLAELNERAQSSAVKDRDLVQTDPARKVIVNDPVPSEEGQPTKAMLGTYIILTDIAEDDPYYEAVGRLAKLRKAKEVIRFAPGGLDDVALRLKELGPEYVCVVAKPETIDMNIASQLLEMSTRLDSDPFPDFLFGFITGATAKDAVQFVKNISKADKRRLPFPRKILHISKSGSSRLRTDVFQWAKGLSVLALSYENREFLRQHIDKMRGNGIIGIHGSSATAQGIADGLMAEDLASLDLYPAVVFSSADYTGVTTRALRLSNQFTKTVTEQVSPGSSFCLQVLGAGATGYFASIGSTSPLLCSQELATLIRTAAPLGRVMKHTHDGIVLAEGEGSLRLPSLPTGKQRPAATPLDWRAQSAATRVLYGDPAFRPFTQGLEPILKVTTRRRQGSLKVSCHRAEGVYDATLLDAFRTTPDGENTRSNDQIRFVFELPKGFDKNITSITAAATDAALPAVKPSFLTCMVEKWGGKKFAHVQMDLPPRSIRQGSFTFEITLGIEK